MECVQIFTKNQRQWRVPALTEEQIREWDDHRRQTGIGQVVSHDSYLINLASPSEDILEKSVALFREEMLRCEALGIPWLVMHPGAHMGAGEEDGLRRVAESFNRLHRDLSGMEVVTCLEITAGQGTTLGYKLEHLRQILDTVTDPQRLAVCLDTAHLLAAGYDLTSGPGSEAVLSQVDEVIGLDRVRVWHLNDSKTPRGSRVDRHEHIGHGHVSLDAFRRIVNHPRFQSVPKILETPKEEAPDGRLWDEVNLEVLRGLMADEAATGKGKTVKKPRKKT